MEKSAKERNLLIALGEWVSHYYEVRPTWRHRAVVQRLVDLDTEKLNDELNAEEPDGPCDECGVESVGHDEDGFPLCQSCGDKRDLEHPEEPKPAASEPSGPCDDKIEEVARALYRVALRSPQFSMQSDFTKTKYRLMAREHIRLRDEAKTKAIKPFKRLSKENAKAAREAIARAEKAEAAVSTLEETCNLWKTRYDNVIARTKNTDALCANLKNAEITAKSNESLYLAANRASKDLEGIAHKAIEEARKTEDLVRRIANDMDIPAQDNLTIEEIEERIFWRIAELVLKEHRIDKSK